MSSRLEGPSLVEILEEFADAGVKGMRLIPMCHNRARRSDEDLLVELKLLEQLPGRVWTFRISLYGREALKDLGRRYLSDARLDSFM